LGSYSAGARYEVVVAVTTPQVATILIDGKRRIPTVALPGLPYGLRGARMLVPVSEPAQHLAKGRRPAHAPALSFVALTLAGNVFFSGRPTSHRRLSVAGGTRSAPRTVSAASVRLD
jgi:hypothetical protein